METPHLDAPPELHDVHQAVAWDRVVPLVREATDNGSRFYEEDGYESQFLFGASCADGLASRLHHAATTSNIGLEPVAESGKWAYRQGRFILHFHRVRPASLVPITGEKVRGEAREVVDLGPRLFDDDEPMGRHLVVGIVSNPLSGLERIVLFELVKVGGEERWGYVYAPIEIYSAFGGGFGDGVEMPPPEDVTPPMVTRTLPDKSTGND